MIPLLARERAGCCGIFLSMRSDVYHPACNLICIIEHYRVHSEAYGKIRNDAKGLRVIEPTKLCLNRMCHVSRYLGMRPNAMSVSTRYYPKSERLRT